MAHVFEGQFEPFAVAQNPRTGEVQPVPAVDPSTGDFALDAISTAVVAQISLAISAKRQADALDRIADALNVLNGQDIFHPEFGLNSAAWTLAKKG